MRLRASQIFQPGAFPAHTYVPRQDAELELALRDALEMEGQLVSVTGPSKSGKTVLVEKVVGESDLITITGAGITSPDQIWDRVLTKIGAPTSNTHATTIGASVNAEVSAEAGGSLLGLLSGKAGGKSGLSGNRSRQKTITFGRGGLDQLIDALAKTTRVLLIDDFHYMDRKVQAEAAKALKEAVRKGVRAIVVSVTHRADDIGRANPELRGRVESIESTYWSDEDLARIAEKGFPLLRASVDEPTLRAFVAEAAGSPHLMQLICLSTCREVELREESDSPIRIALDYNGLRNVFRRTVRSIDFRSHLEVMNGGPRTRGVNRKVFETIHGWKGDVYSVLLAALGEDPPQLSFSYAELSARIRQVCSGEAPSGASVVGCCAQMVKLAQEAFPLDQLLDWDEQKQILDIPEPYFLFFLRWARSVNA